MKANPFHSQERKALQGHTTGQRLTPSFLPLALEEIDKWQQMEDCDLTRTLEPSASTSRAILPVVVESENSAKEKKVDKAEHQ